MSPSDPGPRRVQRSTDRAARAICAILAAVGDALSTLTSAVPTAGRPLTGLRGQDG